jgi:hypothetical protein
LSACSTKEEIVVQEEPAFSDDEINTSTYTDEEAEVEDEIELDLLQSQYPGMDQVLVPAALLLVHKTKASLNITGCLFHITKFFVLISLFFADWRW